MNFLSGISRGDPPGRVRRRVAVVVLLEAVVVLAGEVRADVRGLCQFAARGGKVDKRVPVGGVRERHCEWDMPVVRPGYGRAEVVRLKCSAR